MKLLKPLMFVLAGGLFTVTLFSFVNSEKKVNERTEEYAIVNVAEIGKKKYMRTSIGAAPATEIILEIEKTNIKGDLSPVIKQLGVLNEQGFELVNQSTSYDVDGAGGNVHSNLNYTFIMKKKLK